MDKQPPLNTKVFYAPLSGARLQEFFGEFGGVDHFSLMTIDEYHSKGLQQTALVSRSLTKNNERETGPHSLVHALPSLATGLGRAIPLEPMG